VCGCVCYVYRSCVFLGEENGSAYEASCRGVRGSFAEDAVIAEVFLRTWDGTERRWNEQDFLTYLLGHQELAIQFLKDVGLIRSKVQCNICNEI